MPADRRAALFTVPLIAATLVVILVAGHAWLNEYALRTAVATGDDAAGVRVVRAGVYRSQPKKLQAICTLALENNIPRTLSALLDLGYLPAPTSAPVLIKAVRSCPDAVSALLDHGVPVDERDEFGATALITAAENGQHRITRRTPAECRAGKYGNWPVSSRVFICTAPALTHLGWRAQFFVSALAVRMLRGRLAARAAVPVPTEQQCETDDRCQRY